MVAPIAAVGATGRAVLLRHLSNTTATTCSTPPFRELRLTRLESVIPTPMCRAARIITADATEAKTFEDDGDRAAVTKG